MLPFPLPENEQERLEALHAYHILDTATEQDFDDLTELASVICGVPISLISLVDRERQWFKSHKGIPLTETHRAHSFCAHAIIQPGQVFIVEDAHSDERFKDNPLVTGPFSLTFYAGVPLINPDGYALGSLCVIDTRTRRLTEAQEKALQTLARQVMDKLELRRKNIGLEKLNRELQLAEAISGEEKEKRKQEERRRNDFISMISHEIKSPLTALSGHLQIMEMSLTGNDTLVGDMINKASGQVKRMNNLINDLMDLSRFEAGKIYLDRADFSILSLVNQLADAFRLSHPAFHFHYQSCEELTVNADRDKISNVISQFLTNATKYSPLGANIYIDCHIEAQTGVRISVTDEGKGIRPGEEKKLFDRFLRMQRRSTRASATPLYVCAEIIQAHSGEIGVNSIEGIGSTFWFSIPVSGAGNNR